jgi:uncharacterized YccA/Bax inhibitor family protein
MSEAVYRRAGLAESPAQVMTLQGTIIKTAVLVAVLLLTGAYSWSQVLPVIGDEPVSISSHVIGLLMLGLFGGLITGTVTIFVPRISPVTAPVYAALEGLILGGLSGLFEAEYAGIVVQAVSLTVGILVGLLAIYGGGFIRVTDKFKIGVVAATGGICLVYLTDLIISFSGCRCHSFTRPVGWGLGSHCSW